MSNKYLNITIDHQYSNHLSTGQKEHHPKPKSRPKYNRSRTQNLNQKNFDEIVTFRRVDEDRQSSNEQYLNCRVAEQQSKYQNYWELQENAKNQLFTESETNNPKSYYFQMAKVNRNQKVKEIQKEQITAFGIDRNKALRHKNREKMIQRQAREQNKPQFQQNVTKPKQISNLLEQNYFWNRRKGSRIIDFKKSNPTETFKSVLRPTKFLIYGQMSESQMQANAKDKSKQQLNACLQKYINVQWQSTNEQQRACSLGKSKQIKINLAKKMSKLRSKSYSFMQEYQNHQIINDVSNILSRDQLDLKIKNVNQLRKNQVDSNYQKTQVKIEEIIRSMKQRQKRNHIYQYPSGNSSLKCNSISLNENKPDEEKQQGNSFLTGTGELKPKRRKIFSMLKRPKCRTEQSQKFNKDNSNKLSDAIRLKRIDQLTYKIQTPIRITKQATTTTANINLIKSIKEHFKNKVITNKNLPQLLNNDKLAYNVQISISALMSNPNVSQKQSLNTINLGNANDN